MLFAVALSGLALTACSEDELSTSQYGKNGVNILAFGPMPVTRGETIRLTGTKLNQVKEVLFPEGNQKLTAATTYIPGQFTLTNSEEMTVTIPDLCVPGKLRLVTNSNDTVVSASNITFAEEIKAESITPLHVHPGDIVTIKGEYVWNIAEVTFSAGVKVLAENFVKNTRNEVQVQVPMNVVSGPVTYNDGSEGAEDIVLTNNLEVDVAVATGVSNKTPEYGEEITITGENLDLVETIEFPSFGAVMEFTLVDRNNIKVVVPGTSTSGAIVLTSFSGLTTSVDIEVPLISYEAGSITPNKNLNAGQTVTLKGDNLDRVIQLMLPGEITLEKGQFTQSKNEISFVVPEDMGDGAVKLIQHDNWSVETDRIKMYAPEGPVTVLWKGQKSLGWDAAGQIYIGSDGATELIEADAKPGDKVRLQFNITGGGWCAQILEGHWENCGIPKIDEIKPENYDLEGELGYYYITLTEELLNALYKKQGWGGTFVVQGQNLDIVEYALVKQSSEINISEDCNKMDDAGSPVTFPVALAWTDDAGKFRIMRNGPHNLKDMTLTPNKSKIRLYKEVGVTGQCQVNEPNWKWNETVADWEGSAEYLELTLSQQFIDCITGVIADNWSGTALCCQGDGVKITKVTLVP